MVISGKIYHAFFSPELLVFRFSYELYDGYQLELGLNTGSFTYSIGIKTSSYSRYNPVDNFCNDKARTVTQYLL